MSTLDGVQE